LEWTLADQSPEHSKTEWLCVDVVGYEIINVYISPPSRFTPTTIPMFLHPSLQVGDFNCQHVKWGTAQRLLMVKAWPPGQQPTTLSCCTTQREQPVSPLTDEKSAPTRT